MLVPPVNCLKPPLPPQISDCGAISGIEGSHNYTHNPNQTIAAALNQGGIDVNCGSGAGYYPPHMCNAVTAGTINGTDVDRAARRYWRTMMRLGMFGECGRSEQRADVAAGGLLLLLLLPGWLD